MEHMVAVLAGCFLDQIWGDPKNLPHVVCAVGGLIKKTEYFYRRWFPKTEAGEKTAGICMVISVLGITGGITSLLLLFAYRAHMFAGLALESFICYQVMACKSLKTESMKVYSALRDKDVEKARTAVSMIVGRDTKNLTEEGIIKAAVETVAENTSDGVIAPFCFMILGGGVGGILYKAVNTMDSMVGYQNKTYGSFGWSAAKLDDICNYIPARLSAMAMIAASFLCRYRGRQAIKIFLRDRYKHKSPNSAQTEAVCAGALGIELAGDAWYFGTYCKKPVIGDSLKKIEYQDIKKSNILMQTTYAVFLFISVMVWIAVKMIGS